MIITAKRPAIRRRSHMYEVAFATIKGKKCIITVYNKHEDLRKSIKFYSDKPELYAIFPGDFDNKPYQVTNIFYPGV